MKTPLILFWPHTKDTSVASYRIRCRNVMHGLAASGVSTGFYNGKIRRRLKLKLHLSPPSILVMSKLTKPSSLEWALLLKRRYRTRLVLDICDNIFFGGPANLVNKDSEKIQRTVKLLNQFDAIITPSFFLREKISEHLRQDMQFIVIPDAIELPTKAGIYRRWKKRDSFKELEKLKEFHKETPISSGRRLVWYGNHGTDLAQNGMYDVERISNILEMHNSESPISLTLISNNKEKYERIFGTSKFPTFYQEWNECTFYDSLRLHDIAIIPVGENDYNMSKSANRLTTALINDLAVCASTIESYLPFRESAILDDWHDALRRLMLSPSERQKRVALGREVIEQTYTQAAIIAQWRSLLKELS